MLNPPSIESFHGDIRSITGADPAAGDEITITVPTRRRWRIHAIHITLITDATVADRQIIFWIDDGASVLYRYTLTTIQTASLTNLYSFAPSSTPEIATTTKIVVPIPMFVLPAGCRIQTLTTNIQAGDNYNAPQILVEEWIDPT